MMNQETPQKKSQNQSSGSQPQAEEDLDFEILDALENIDDTGDDSGASLNGTDDEFSLDLDDDLIFDADRLGETEQFSMEIEAAVGVGMNDADDGDADSSQFTGELGSFGLDADIGDDVQVDENDDGSFSLNLDDDDDLDISFDNDIDLDWDGDLGTSTFDAAPSLEVEDFGISDEGSSDLDLGVFNAPSIKMNDGASDDTVSLNIEGDELVASPEFDMGVADDGFAEEIGEPFGDKDDEIDIDNMPDLDGTMAEFATTLDSDDGLSDTEFAEMKTEQESEGFSGKGVISINGEQVIDLGDEDDIGSITDSDNASWGSDDDAHADDDDYAEDDFLDDDDDDIDLAELAKGAEEIVGNVVDDGPEEEPAGEEDFMASLDSISIDLHDDDDAEDEPDAFGSDVDDVELPEEDFDVPSLSDVLTEIQVDGGLEDGFEAESLAAAERAAGLNDEESQDAEEPELDVREALGLVPRLVDDDIQKFDQMVLEAKTLQHYIEELEEHRPEIKTAIYDKLLKEYSDRKTDIFREPDFISIRIDVEQDLEDMLRKRADVQRTVSSLNDELEEVQVRHLVGEYTDDELAGQETSRKTEIDVWQHKTDRLEQFIVQYQELLETEKALNPGEEELEEEPMAADMPPLEETPDAFDVEGDALSHELESLVSEEDTSFAEEPPEEEEPSLEEAPPCEDLSSITEDDERADETAEEDAEDAGDEMGTSEERTSATHEEESADISLDDLSEEIAGMDDLTGMLEVDDSSDWEDGDADDFELTAESFDDDDFSLDADFADDEEFTGLDAEDFELNGLTDVDDTTNADDETLAALAFGGIDDENDENDESSEPEEAMVSCKKCGRSTPSSEKFCVNCGAKAQ